MLAATAICLVPVYLVVIPVSVVFVPVFTPWFTAAQVAAQAGLAPPPTPPGFALAGLAVFATGLLVLLGSTAAIAAILRVAHATFVGQKPSARRAVSEGLGRLPALITADVLTLILVVLILIAGIALAAPMLAGGGIATFLGLIAVVSTIVGVAYLFTRTTLAQQAAVIDRTGGAESIARSWRLTAGAGWRVFGYGLFIALIDTLLGLLLVSVPVLVLRLEQTSAVDVAVATVVEAAATLVLLPLVPLFLTMLYYDLRWRRGEPTSLPGSEVAAPPPRASDSS